MKKALAIFITTALFALFLTSCDGNSGTTEDDQATVSVSGIEADGVAANADSGDSEDSGNSEDSSNSNENSSTPSEDESAPNALPRSGGTATVTSTTEYGFRPDSSGLWVIETSNDNDCDPQLSLYNQQGFVAGDDDGAVGLNARIVLHLDSETTYVIHAGYYDNEESGEYTLTVSKAEVGDSIPSSGGSAAVVGTVAYSFSPNSSGLWVIETSNRAEACDPYLWLYDPEGLIESDDDGNGDLNSRIVVYLDEETTYTIFAGYYDDEDGQYTLSVITLEAESNIPANGGTADVAGTTAYSFRPNSSGMWTIETSNEIEYCDPYLWLYVPEGLIASDDDGAGGSNARMVVYLDAETTYTILAGYYGGGDGNGQYTLTVGKHEVNSSIPAGGGSVTVTGTTEYSFTPDSSGRWTIETSNETEDCDPYLWLYGGHGTIAEDDDSGDYPNASITMYLEAGEMYVIRAGYYGYDDGGYTLTVGRGNELGVL
ncbi:MAG: hypothetical protein FWG87_06390 [Defluviitaleaceae bacterium]|nr:hypothetical protein [Defluviitaleaceae bacterium]